MIVCMRAAGNQKCRRKDTWERLQRRHAADGRGTAAAAASRAEPAAWGVPAENDRCRTAVSSGRAARPDRLPLTSERHLERIVYELPSPTAVSLHGNVATPELASKSSSAPVLIKSTQTLPRTKHDVSEVVRAFYRICAARWRVYGQGRGHPPEISQKVSKYAPGIPGMGGGRGW